MTHAIEAEGLEKTFGTTVHALDGVSFTVERGTVFGLLGPNGAGKTTAVRVLTTILRPDRGSGRVLGHDVVNEAAQVRGLIGLAGQYATVDENLTGRENLVMVGRLNHLPRERCARRATELLVRFDLDGAGDRTLKTYSGGMRRRLDLAAALVAQPPVLFLDEPTTGLDLRSRNDLWEMIEGLVEEGTTVLLTTQYLEEADRLARHIAVVDHGGVIAEGTPARLKADLGATVLDVGLVDHAAAAAAAGVLEAVGTKPPTVEGSSVELTVDNGPAAALEALRILDTHALFPTT
ncbi:MAG TPA: ATP-binding cassette domain-containing protein, partial [Acidimicrobiales bacterium]|nr:ATP-binding cassette domain-containing protein [Acidimicrobiales bacterium]